MIDGTDFLYSPMSLWDRWLAIVGGNRKDQAHARENVFPIGSNEAPNGEYGQSATQTSQHDERRSTTFLYSVGGSR